MRYYFIYYKLESDDMTVNSDFIKFITSNQGINSCIEATLNNKTITANLPNQCLVAPFDDNFTPKMVHQFFEDSLKDLSVSFEDLVCVEMHTHDSFYMGEILH